MSDDSTPRSARSTLSVIGALLAVLSVWLWRRRSDDSTAEGDG